MINTIISKYFRYLLMQGGKYSNLFHKYNSYIIISYIYLDDVYGNKFNIYTDMYIYTI